MTKLLRPLLILTPIYIWMFSIAEIFLKDAFRSRAFSVERSSSETAKMSHDTKNNKPLLVLHVGPTKTGTTTIQMNLGSSQTQNQLLNDNYTHIDFNYIQLKKLIKECFDLGKDCNENGLWKTLMERYHNSTNFTNAIHSSECFSRIPRNAHTTQRLRSLQEHFRVHVIVAYRRVYEWLPSQYHQSEKGKFFKARSGRWKNWSRPHGPDERISFVDFFNDYFPKMRDSYSVRNLYSKIFGEDAVTVMPVPRNEALLSEFYCHALPNANHTCSMSQQLEKRRQRQIIANPSSQFLFEHDRLLEKARNLIPSHLKNDRHAATVALERRLAQLNLTIHNLPQECLTSQQEDDLWKYTLLAEQEIAPNPVGRDELYQSFQDYRWNFCSVNVMATLQSETWRNVISSMGDSSGSQVLQ